MKKYISFLVAVFFTFSAFAQKDTSATSKRSVIALDKVKVVYRGIVNPISIAVSNCKSFTISGLGVQKDEEGKYHIAPGQGLEAKIVVTIINFDDSISIEEHTFKIENVPLILAKINNNNCYNCIIELSKEDIKNAIITVGLNDFKFDLNMKNNIVEWFTVKLKSPILVNGNKFSEEALKEINKLKVGTMFIIEDVHYSNPNDICRSPLNPLKIMITD